MRGSCRPRNPQHRPGRNRTRAPCSLSPLFVCFDAPSESMLCSCCVSKAAGDVNKSMSRRLPSLTAGQTGTHGRERDFGAVVPWFIYWKYCLLIRKRVLSAAQPGCSYRRRGKKVKEPWTVSKNSMTQYVSELLERTREQIEMDSKCKQFFFLIKGY